VKRYSFCPVCGAALSRAAAGTSSIVTIHRCPSCHFEFWQNSKPAVGALATRSIGGVPHVLLTRRGIEPYKDYWDLPGGYLENGEHPRDGLAREILEELRARATVLDLVGSDIAEYPRDDVAEEARFVLVLYYRCEISADDPLIPGDDVVEARWFPLTSLPTRLAFEANRKALALLDSLVTH